MKTRVLSALALAPLLGIIFLEGIPLYLFEFALIGLALKEYFSALNKNTLFGFNALTLLIPGYLLFSKIFNAPLKLSVSLGLMILVLVIVMLLIHKITLKDSILILLGILYLVLGFECIVLTKEQINFGETYVWLIFIISITSDVSAYFTGKIFGKNKLAPTISPNKTIEGSVGAIIFCTLACLIFGKVFGLSIKLMMLLGVLGSVTSQIGDLIASSLKRRVGIKDYGNLIPGHGGVLDRLDSTILVSQFIFIVLFLLEFVF